MSASDMRETQPRGRFARPGYSFHTHSDRNLLRAVRQPRRHTDRGAAGRHVMLDDRAGADLGEIADADAADNARSGAEINSPADFRGAVGFRMFSADGDVL